MRLPKYSIGIGDRFAHQGKAQLTAILEACNRGVPVTPVWNKSHREHSIIHSSPADVRTEANAAFEALGWHGPYFVDADHIGMKNVDIFLESSDFFTLDVADYIGQPPDEKELASLVRQQQRFVGTLRVEGLREVLEVTPEMIEAIGRKYLAAVKEAGRIYRRIADRKGRDAFVTEVSMDETNEPQTPVEMLFILAAIAVEGIPAQTIAPRFSGRFNKGVDYVGDPKQFAAEFEADLAVIHFAIKEFNLPPNLKLSVHSGSDKFSIYGPIRDALRRTGAGLHLKTAGTTWLEELIGLAMAGGDGLEIAKEVYEKARARAEELCKPYASVIDIDPGRLPSVETVRQWDGEAFAEALRHDQSCPRYNPHLRQLLHVGYKVAAEMGPRFTAALEKHAEVIAQGVTENIYQRHLRQIFPF